jgi:beta-glucosidase
MASLFPPGFLFGAATAAHQVEGNNHNQWSEWEQANAVRLAKAAEARYLHNPNTRAAATNSQNYISGLACDHYQRYQQDLNLLKGLGLNAYRFSIEWSRIFPAPGQLNTDALHHYEQMLQLIQRQGITPMVTLWHFTNPVWFENLGGWTNKANIQHFTEFVAAVITKLNPYVNLWVVLNEPEIYAAMSFKHGGWPPGERNFLLHLQVQHNLQAAHKAAYKIIKQVAPEAQVGIAKNNVYYHPKTHSLVNRFLAWTNTYLRNYYLLDRIKHQLDFIGINYYFDEQIDLWRKQNPHQQLSDLGWGLAPESITLLIADAHKRYCKPIYITENGLADADDKYRGEYIQRVIPALAKALKQGADLRGYMHWSLMDNFEWAEGFWPRFGLIEIDYQTQERKIRESAKQYASLIKLHTRPQN